MVPLLGVGAVVSGVSGLGRVRRGEATGARTARIGIALGALSIMAFVGLIRWVL
ncbi:hypothetical protein AB0I22_01330 [Streptomyces sp. NPDC050610]|uniref:hypothetical protein n=1 Tax=Streptomyces sp. NPDC050610 TaxID=3157097 RepID=UPI0034178631